MDVNPIQNNQASQTSNDDELAKVLANVNKDTDAQPKQSDIAGLQFEETPAPTPNTNQTPQQTPATPPQPATTTQQPEQPPVMNTPVDNSPAPATSASPELENIKRNALEELRPLVDRLNLPPEEKFDTLLLIIRSTDDQSLVQSAHEAAKSITDDTKRAQALLDVIKEIDYFSNPAQHQQQ